MTGTLIQGVADVGVHLSFSPDHCGCLTWGTGLASESHPHPAFKAPPVRGVEADGGDDSCRDSGQDIRVLGTSHLWVLSTAGGTSRHPILPHLGSKPSAMVTTVLCILPGACPGALGHQVEHTVMRAWAQLLDPCDGLLGWGSSLYWAPTIYRAHTGGLWY